MRASLGPPRTDRRRRTQRKGRRLQAPPALQEGVEKLQERMGKVNSALAKAIEPTMGAAAPASEGRKQLDTRNLGLRVATGMALAIISIFTIYLGVTAFTIEAIPLIAIGIVEFCGLAERKGLAPSRRLAVLGGLTILAAYAWWPYNRLESLATIVGVTLLLTMSAYLLRRGDDGYIIETHFLDCVGTMFAYMYVAWLFGFALLLRRLPDLPLGHPEPVHVGFLSMDAGAAWLYMVVITTAFSDIGSFAFGKAFGRTPMAPRISPGKTWEGSIGGLVTATVLALLMGHAVGLAPYQGLLYGLAVGFFSQLGDLWESGMKRDCGVKDSGRVLAGHGGVLDRFDSYFFAAPVAYLLIVWFKY